MFFLNPIALWGLLATAVPILMHLERNRGARLVSFPCVRFLEELQQQRFWSVRVQEILLLLLRLALVCLIVGAATLPRIEAGPGSWAAALLGARGMGRPEAVGILLDSSLSMGYTTESGRLCDAAVRHAEALLQPLPPGTTIVVDSFGSSGDDGPPQSTTRREAALRALRAADPAGSPRDAAPRLLDALQRMLAALAVYGSSHLVVLTDLQATTWNALAAGGAADDLRRRMAEQNTRCSVVAVQAPQAANVWLDDIAAPVLPRPPWLRYTVPVSVCADPAVRAGTEPLRVNVMVADEAGIGRVHPVTLQPSEDLLKSTVSIPIEPRSAGEAVGDASAVVRRVRIEPVEGSAPDPLPQDDSVTLRLPVAAASRVLLVSPETDGIATRALDAALRSGPLEGGKPLFELSVCTTAELVPERVQGHDAVVIPGEAAAPLDETRASLLVEAVRGGMGLVWIVGAGEAGAGAERQSPLAQALGVRVTGVAEGSFGMRPAAADHPLCRTLAGFPESAWGHVRVRRVVQVAAPESALYEAAPAVGSPLPLVMERDYGRGRMIVVTTGLEPAWSSLAVAPQFVALLQESVTYLAARRSGWTAQPVIERAAPPAESRLAPLSAADRLRLEQAMACTVQDDSAPVLSGGRSLAGLLPEQTLLLLALACALAESYLANRL